jgi:hypothetical protein
MQTGYPRGSLFPGDVTGISLADTCRPAGPDATPSHVQPGLAVVG